MRRQDCFRWRHGGDQSRRQAIIWTSDDSVQHICISRESWDLFLLSLHSFMTCRNSRIYCDPMVVFVCFLFAPPHYHQYADVCKVNSVDCVSKIKSIISFIFHAIYVCISLPLSLMIIVMICVFHVIIIKSEVLLIFSLFRLSSWNNGIRCMFFYIPMDK